MVFSSAVFVFGFMPLLLFLYFLAEPKYRNYILLIFSLIFYGWGGVNYLLLMLAVVMSDYVFAIAIAQIKTQKIRKLFVVLSVVVNLGVLGYYKYTNFFIENINHFIKNDIKIATIVLPIGISFFTFQAMSYVIDVYRGDVAAQKNPFYVMLYVSLFPQLVAGPIVRYKTVENEIAHRQIHMEDVADGLERFILGFAKKIIIANNVGALADKIFENNQVSIMGEIVSDFRFSHEVYGEGFYMVDVAVNRLSNYLDYIPLMISERLIDVNADYIGQIIYVNGQFRSFNRHEEKKNRLVLSVFVRELEFLEELQEDMKSNQIFLDGYICKVPVYRKTPLGREIADVLLAVNRPYGKSDYIPCICWGRNARFADGFQVGDHIQLWGRIQSREYQKRIGDEEFETRIAYEISVSKLERMDSMSAVVAASEESGSDGFDTYGMDDE